MNPYSSAPQGRHQQVFAAAVTFSLGLFLVRIILAYFGPEHHKAPASPWNDPLLLLMVISTGATLLYAILRLEEGDFRALFLLTLGLFISAEVVEYLASVFALAKINDLGTVLSFSVSIYGLLALTAAFYDYPKSVSDPVRSAMIAACTGLSAASATRALAPVAGLADERIPEIIGVAILLGAALCLVTALVRTSRSGSEPFQVHSGGPPPGEALKNSYLDAPVPGRGPVEQRLQRPEPQAQPPTDGTRDPERSGATGSVETGEKPA